MQTDNFLNSFLNVLVMVALMLPAFILRKKKMLPDGAVAAFVAVLIYACQPFLTISSFLSKPYEPALLIGMGVTFLLALVVNLVSYLVARLVFFLSWRGEGERPEVRASNAMAAICSQMSNTGFMGIPVMRILFPDNPEMLIYTAVFIVGGNIFNFTFGIFAITGDRKFIRPLRAFLNPPTVSIVIALPLFFFKSYIPAAVLTPIDNASRYMGDMTLPLSMMILGVRLAEMKPRELLRDPRSYAATAFKLIASPMLSFGICMLVHIAFPALDGAALATVFMMMAMPTAAVTLSFAEMYDGDRATSVRCLILSTILSVISIPLLTMIAPLL